jgi:hypothetical protein
MKDNSPKTLVKEFLGVPIYVSDKGKFSASRDNVSKESVNMRMVERWIAETVPAKFPVKVEGRPGAYGVGGKYTVVRIKAPERNHWQQVPRLVLKSTSYYESEVALTQDIVWPDKELDEQVAALSTEKKAFERLYEERMKALAAKYKTVTVKDLTYALEHGGVPAGADELGPDEPDPSDS